MCAAESLSDDRMDEHVWTPKGDCTDSCVQAGPFHLFEGHILNRPNAITLSRVHANKDAA